MLYCWIERLMSRRLCFRHGLNSEPSVPHVNESETRQLLEDCSSTYLVSSISDDGKSVYTPVLVEYLL